MNRRLLDLAITKTAFEFLKNPSQFLFLLRSTSIWSQIRYQSLYLVLRFSYRKQKYDEVGPSQHFQENVKKTQLKIMTLTVGIQKIKEIVETHVYTYPPPRIRIFTILPILILFTCPLPLHKTICLVPGYKKYHNTKVHILHIQPYTMQNGIFSSTAPNPTSNFLGVHVCSAPELHFSLSLDF